MTIYLIGGAPCTGKSTYARKLATELNCSWISTDVIRDFMRTLLKPEDYPDFFEADVLSAEEYYTKHSGHESFMNELGEGKVTQLGVTNFIKQLDNYGHWETYLIEGIALTPEYMNYLKNEFPEITFVSKALYMGDAAEIKKRIFTRGLWDGAGDYADWVKEIEVTWVIEANEWFKNQATEQLIDLITLNF